MYVTWKPKSKSVALYNDNNAIIRKFITKAEVVNAHVTGAGKTGTVAITMSNGKTEIYKTNGEKIKTV